MDIELFIAKYGVLISCGLAVLALLALFSNYEVAVLLGSITAFIATVSVQVNNRIKEQDLYILSLIKEWAQSASEHAEVCSNYLGRDVTPEEKSIIQKNFVLGYHDFRRIKKMAGMLKLENSKQISKLLFEEAFFIYSALIGVQISNCMPDDVYKKIYKFFQQLNKESWLQDILEIDESNDY